MLEVCVPRDRGGKTTVIINGGLLRLKIRIMTVCGLRFSYTLRR